jgi:hypothetical protein
VAILTKTADGHAEFRLVVRPERGSPPLVHYVLK